jgi:predicted transcriptional regulator
MAERVRVSFEMPVEMNKILDKLADSLDSTRTDVLRKAIALLQVVAEGKEKGQQLALVDKQDQITSKIIGL